MDFETKNYLSYLALPLSILVISTFINPCTLHNQRDATYTMFYIIISALHVSDGFSAHHQELIKLFLHPW